MVVGGFAPTGLNVNNNYGVLPANRTHIFNIAYSIELGNFVKDKIAGGFINGWQLSGIVPFRFSAGEYFKRRPFKSFRQCQPAPHPGGIAVFDFHDHAYLHLGGVFAAFLFTKKRPWV